jgi:hypothetical protein
MATDPVIEIRLRWWCMPLIKGSCFVLKWLPLVSMEQKMKMAYAICGWVTSKAVKTKLKKVSND